MSSPVQSSTSTSTSTSSSTGVLRGAAAAPRTVHAASMASTVPLRRAVTGGGVPSGFVHMLAGAGAGLASTVAGHPFDTIKVRLQTQGVGSERLYRNALDCGLQMARSEGVLSLFKGMSTPLVARGFMNAICFYSYNRAILLLHPPTAVHHADAASGSRMSATAQQARAPFHSVFLAGALAGVATTFITAPSELVKIRLQLEGRPAAAISGEQLARGASRVSATAVLPPFSGPLSGTLALMRREGVLSLYSGAYATACREFAAVGGFFFTIEVMRRASADHFPDASPSLSAVLSMTGGAAAGMAGWSFCYPLDVWKSRLQEGGARPSFFRFCAARIRHGGLLSMYSGLGPTLLRAVPVNAAKFFTFDLLLRILPAYLAGDHTNSTATAS
jgi:solute carrier family 25 (mitochondrial carnitine/acylcarnitine transporter), member 20/29